MTLRKMNHKEDKLQRTGTAFSEMEQTVYNSLYTLIKDCAVLRDYCAAAVLIQQVSSCPARIRAAVKLYIQESLTERKGFTGGVGINFFMGSS